MGYQEEADADIQNENYNGDDYNDDDSNDETSSQAPSEVQIPNAIRDFLEHFHQSFVNRSIYELQVIYENDWNKLTENYYASSSWPDAEVIAPIVKDDATFLILYRELYYRHVYNKLQPSIEDRFNSYGNYCDLFNYILNSSEKPCELELPNQWLWDIIDEFIYQFQSFSSYRGQLHKRSEQEMSYLNRSDVWNVHNVLNVLYSLIQKSKINEQLMVNKTGGDMLEVAGEFGSKTLYRMLGYFSIIGLLRVHCLLGDYVLAMKTMENIQLNKKGLFARVIACHSTTYYYVGFSYMMMRRYTDAIRSFAHILHFLSTMKQHYGRSYQSDAIGKTTDRLFALLAMCVTLSPHSIDDSVSAKLKERHAEDMAKMQAGGEDGLAKFSELFTFASPKFVSPYPPELDSGANASGDSLRFQTQMFMREVRVQLLVPTVRSFLRMYSTLGLDKFAAFLGVTPEEVLHQLYVFKTKIHQRQWDSGSVLDGNMGPTCDLDLYLKQDTIHVTESKQGSQIGNWFIRHTNKFDEIVDSLQKRGN